MHIYNGKIVQTDNLFMLAALKLSGVGTFETDSRLEIPDGEEFALEYRAAPHNLMLVKVVTVQVNPAKGTYSIILMRRGAFYRPDELKGGLEKFLAEQSVSEIDV